MIYMSNKQIYKQCILERPSKNGKYVDQAWIPASFAKIGRNLSVKNSEDEWIDGWVVTFVGGSRNFDELNLQRDAQKRWESVLK